MKTRSGILLLLLAFAGTGVLRAQVAYAQAHMAEHAVAIDKARQLLRAGQFEEAMEAYGHWKDEFGPAVLAEAQAAQRAGNSDEALNFFRAYFRYFPFGSGVYWPATNWPDAARDYIALLEARRAAGKAINAGEERELAAAQIYNAEMGEPRDANETYVQREQRLNLLLEKFPDSLFVPGAVELLRQAMENRVGGDVGDKYQLWREKLASIKTVLHASGATRNEYLIGSVLVGSLGGSFNNLAEMRAAHALIDDLLKLAAFDYERRDLLLRRAEVAWGTGDFHYEKIDLEMMELRVRLYRDVIQKYPGTIEADRAEIRVYESLLRAGRIDDALATFREAEKVAPPDKDFSTPLIMIANYYTLAEYGKINKDWPKAQALYEEVIRRNFAGSASAHLRLGELLTSVGKDEQAPAHFRAAYKLTGGLENDANTKAGDVNYIASEAARALATHAEKKGAWTEALKWWQVFKPYGWCGNGIAALRNLQAFHIALCLQKLRRVDEAIMVLEPYVTQPQLDTSPETIKFVVDLYDGRRQLPLLKQKAEAALAHPEYGRYNEGAKLALKEIAMRTSPKAGGSKQ